MFSSFNNVQEGSGEESDVTLEVPDELIFKSSNEGAGVTPEVPDELRDNKPTGHAQVDVEMTEAQPEKPEETLINPVEPEFQSMVDILVTQEKPVEPRPPLVDTTSGELECRVTRLEKKVHSMSSFNHSKAIEKSVKAHLKNVLPKDVPYCGKIKLDKAKKSVPKNSSTPVDQEALDEFEEKD
ncbi:hypothetical protein Tco_0621980 [Tanacetum coccineum]